LANHPALFALFAGVEMLYIIIVAIHTLPKLYIGLMSSPGWLMIGKKWNTCEVQARMMQFIVGLTIPFPSPSTLATLPALFCAFCRGWITVYNLCIDF